jgi:hypothetical protein
MIVAGRTLAPGASAGVETRISMPTKDLLKICDLDTPLGLHSGLLDQQNSPEIQNCQVIRLFSVLNLNSAL